jgi:hypothetical protein
MYLNSVLYGPSLKRYNLGSYSYTNVGSVGFGGVIKPPNIYVPTNLHLPQINASLNVLDIDHNLQEKSDFSDPKTDLEKEVLKTPKPAFSPEKPPGKELDGFTSQIGENIVKEQKTEPYRFVAQKLDEVEFASKRATKRKTTEAPKTVISRRSKDHHFNVV